MRALHMAPFRCYTTDRDTIHPSERIVREAPFGARRGGSAMAARPERF